MCIHNKTIYVLILLLFSSSHVHSQNLTCGGHYNNSDLKIEYNPIADYYSATTDQENIVVYIKPHKNDGFKLTFFESLSPESYDLILNSIANLKEELQNLIKQKIANKIITLYSALNDNVLHFEFVSGENIFSLSCVKHKNEPENHK